MLIDPHWPARRAALTGPAGRLHPEDRLLLLTPIDAATAASADDEGDWHAGATVLRLGIADQADWAALAAALTGVATGTWKTAATLWPRARVLAGDPAAFPLGGAAFRGPNLSEIQRLMRSQQRDAQAERELPERALFPVTTIKESEAGGCRPNHWTDPDHGIDYVALCGGEFWMGSPADEPGRDEDEGPRHRVRISPFSLARTETTNAQYRRQHPDHKGADDLPVANVTWDDAQAFCTAIGGGGRLPTEAEWEYAARASSDGRWSFGDNEARLRDHAWYADNSDGKPQPVATLARNPWGLYDMHGNVWEWVADWYADAYPDGTGVRVDPTGPPPAAGTPRVLRSGVFFGWAVLLRSAFRGGFAPEVKDRGTGFRCARAPRRQP